MKVSRRFPERAQYLHSEDDGGDSEGELDAIASYEGYYFLEDGVEGADGQPVFYHCYDKDGFYFGDGEVSCEDQDVYYTIGKGFASIPKGFATDIAPKGFSSIPKGFATDNVTVPKGFDTDIAPKGFSSIPKGFPTINTSVNSTPKSCATIGASVNTTGKGFDTDSTPVDTIWKGFDTDSTPVDTIWKGFDTDAGCTVPEINGVAGCQHGAYLFADRK